MLRVLAAAGVIAGGTAMSQSPTAATVFLTNGDRLAGVVTYQDAGAPPDSRVFQIQTADGRRHAIPADRVAIVDFAGGTPSAFELDALGADTPHLLTLRNGNSRPGRLIGVIDGEFVRWETPSGRQVDVPIRNVTRVYLNQESALAQFEDELPDGRGAAGWASWIERSLWQRPEIVVDPSSAWTATRLSVTRDERLRFTATGWIRLSRTPGDATGPGGRTPLRRAGAPLPEAPVGALIARVGDGTPFAIGARQDAVVMPASGPLFLGINDDTLADNSGSYRVTIHR